MPLSTLTPLLRDDYCYHCVVFWDATSYAEYKWPNHVNFFQRDSLPDELHGGGVWRNDTPLFYSTQTITEQVLGPGYLDSHEPPNVPANQRYNFPNEFRKYKPNFKGYASLNNTYQVLLGLTGYVWYQQVLMPFHEVGTGEFIKNWIKNSKPAGQSWKISVYQIPCTIGSPSNSLPIKIEPKKEFPLVKVQLPNHPQHYKPMDCCDKVEEIYKYLGIAKLKKNKFPISNAFLVPGGKGNDDCVDYYAIAQALFRMLANGLIINPKSKPLGSEWQNANATAWASAMYEMMPETMSDGNSTQRFEIAAMMQLTQIMATIAENGRKIEFVADGIGFEPVPEQELLPVCFTIHESHKGFGKKEPKKINVSGTKTDEEVEKILGTMLNPSLVPIVKWKFKPGQISISEALRRG